MSSSEVIQKYGNRGQQLWDCCDPVVPVQRLMGNTQSNMFPCNSCDPPNQFVFTAVARDIVIPTNLNTPVGASQSDFDQTFVLDSIDIVRDTTDQYFSVSIGATLYSLGILNVVYSGDTVSTPTSTAYTILQGNFNTEEALLTTDTLGSFSVTIAITTDEGVYTFEQPYNVVNDFQLTGVARNTVDDLNTPLVVQKTDVLSSPFVLDSIDIAQNLGEPNVFFDVTISATVGDVVVSDVVYSGDTLSTPVSTAYTVLEGGTYTETATLVIDTIGSFSVEITITTADGEIFEFVQPYNVV